MCCFSRPVQSVSATRIFARFTDKTRQAVVYQMRLDAPEDLAMILPIPVSQPVPEDALKFVNLEGYRDFFKDLAKGFPVPRSRSKGLTDEAVPAVAPQLKVHSVGAFDASFVPNIGSFERLDARFRLPKEVWGKLPQYARYGFAVFKLKEGHSEVHPMAFTFPSAIGGRLFFPTVHIHDGKVHPKEKFDHILYGQAGPNALISGWNESPRIAGAFVDTKKAKNLVAPSEHLYRRKIIGLQENVDALAPISRFGE
jgi:hypothetical protein